MSSLEHAATGPAPDAEAHRALRDAAVLTLAHNIDLVRGWFVEYLESRYGRGELAAALARPLDEATLRGWFEDWLQRTVASDARFGGTWLAALMEAEAGRAAQALAVRDRVAFGDWTRAFALGGRARSSAPLPPPSEHLMRAGHPELPAGLGSHAELEARAARDTSPLPDTAQREGYHGPHHFDYWRSGLADHLAILSTLARHGVALAPGARVLELGCASGRVLRHFRHQVEGLEVWGCDINASHVEWVGRHLPPDVRVFQNTVLPSLPLPDASFALVFAFSVFTHIDEFERSWIAELARVLAPGGIAYLTVHTEHTWSIVDRAGPLRADLERVRDQIADHAIGPALFAGPLPSERTVFRWTAALSNNTTVFLATEHIRRAWGAFLEVVEIVREGASYQDVVVLRRR
jgi:SAM-dependent methyltransferase